MPDVSDVTFTGPLDSITDAEVLDVDLDAEAGPPSPAPDALERSIRRRRRVLIGHMNELERVIRAKLDVRSRLRRTRERAALRVEMVLEELVERVRERPLPFLVAGSIVLWMLFRRRRY
jgi:hypothetical protein